MSILRNFFIAVLLTLPTQLIAGNSLGLVTTPLVNTTYFMFSAGEHIDKPECATSPLGTWAVPLNTDAGRAMFSLVLSAHAQKKQLRVIGKNNCDTKGDRESVSYLYIVE